MTIKKDVLTLLEQHPEEAISGAAIAEQLAVSRTAVWKAINDLRREGYAIAGATNKGYQLAKNDILSVAGIQAQLSEQTKFSLHVFDCVGSTSDVAKEMAAQGAPHFTAVIAESQTAARGRRGRNFFAPPKSGVYLSLLIRPEGGWEKPEIAVRLTTAASVAVARAVEQVTGQQVAIKWVNDLYLGEQKICGILTEGITSLETGTIEAAVIGIGINLYAPAEGFPEELQDKAVSLLPAEVQNEEAAPSRNQLIAAVLDQMAVILQELECKTFIQEYRERSCVIGRVIRIISPKTEENATALDIDENGGLVVRTASGAVKTLNSGEITIRWREAT